MIDAAHQNSFLHWKYDWRFEHFNSIDLIIQNHPNLSKVAMSCAVSDSLSLLWGSGTGSTQCGRTKELKVSENTSKFRSTTGTTMWMKNAWKWRRYKFGIEI